MEYGFLSAHILTGLSCAGGRELGGGKGWMANTERHLAESGLSE